MHKALIIALGLASLGAVVTASASDVYVDDGNCVGQEKLCLFSGKVGYENCIAQYKVCLKAATSAAIAAQKKKDEKAAVMSIARGIANPKIGPAPKPQVDKSSTQINVQVRSATGGPLVPSLSPEPRSPAHVR